LAASVLPRGKKRDCQHHKPSDNDQRSHGPGRYFSFLFRGISGHSTPQYKRALNTSVGGFFHSTTIPGGWTFVPFFYSGHGKSATGKLANALPKQMRKLARGRRGENAERRRLP
jgi:hypothetical protein